MQRPEVDELPLVMAEIAGAMAARGAALTIHPDDGSPSRVIYAGHPAMLGTALIERLLVDDIVWDHADGGDHHRWIRCAVDDRCRDVLLVPVALIDGHSRLVISVYFDDLDDARKAEAEQVYIRRAPFAIGYFRLWQLNRTRERALSAMKAALNLTSMAIILLDRGGQIVFANGSATLLFTEADGLRRSKDTIRATKVGDSVRLLVAIDHVIAANAAGSASMVLDRHAPIFTLERSGRPALMVSVLPTEEIAIEIHDVAAIVYAMDPSTGVTDLLRPICKAYGLSPVETQLTCNLTGGLTLAGSAKAMRVKEMTARTYLKQIFLKTNTHRQTELMQLMLSSIIRTSADIVALPIETGRVGEDRQTGQTGQTAS